MSLLSVRTLRSSAWMKPSRVPSAAYTADVAPGSLRLSEDSVGPSLAVRMTHMAAAAAASPPRSSTTRTPSSTYCPGPMPRRRRRCREEWLMRPKSDSRVGLGLLYLKESFRTQSSEALPPQLGLAGGLLGRRDGIASHRQSRAPRHGFGDGRVLPGLVAQGRDRALHVGLRRQPDRDVEPHDVDGQRVVAQDAGGE